MNRRDTLAAMSVVGITPQAAWSQPGNKMPVIGFMHPGFPDAVKGPANALVGLRAGLSSNGHIEGKTIRIEERFAEGKYELLSTFVQELIRLKVDLIVAVSPVAVKAAATATKTVPIVAHDLETDPVAGGLVASLARPGGNLTGLFLNHADLAAKWLQLITDVVPTARRLAVLWDANTGPYPLDAIKAAAATKSIRLQCLNIEIATA